MLAIVCNEVLNVARDTAKKQTRKKRTNSMQIEGRGGEFLDVSLSSTRFITSYVQSYDLQVRTNVFSSASENMYRRWFSADVGNCDGTMRCTWEVEP